MSFKIIGIEALENCDIIHSKLLKKNNVYTFFKSYDFKKNQIIFSGQELDLYSRDFNKHISLSAIVGKNGSGKSTIVELVIKAINNFFYYYSIKNPKKKYHPVSLIDGLYVNLFYQYEKEEVYKLSITEDQYHIYKFLKDGNTYSNPSLCKNELKDFFYTEVLNYSLYAFNEKMKSEKWVSPLFHKNDGYQTPVVLNPFRREGIIDVNKENDLVFQRLLSNLFRYDLNKKPDFDISDNLYVSKIILSLKKNKEKIDYDTYDDQKNQSFKSLLLKDLNKIDKNLILKKFYKAFLGEELNLKNKSDKIANKCAHYVLAKLVSICLKYDDYKDDFFDKDTKEFKDINEFLNKLKDDSSHITLKLRQVLNYLKHNHIDFVDSIVKNEFDVGSLARRINDLSNDNILPFLPPPIFDIDLELIPNNKKSEDQIYFRTLSSGEKQFIYFVNSIYYHLLNLDSVHNNEISERTPYKYVTIILEEIELYFHPDYQRKLIDSLLYGLKKINFNGIKAFHFIFVTHSPFILSDIPSSNILYLKVHNNIAVQDLEKKKTFGANIHDILYDNFFFEDGVYIGEFAHKKIKGLINFIKNDKKEDRTPNELKGNYELIKLIDEPILKSKLLEMFIEKYENFDEKDKLENEMIRSYADRYGKDIEIK
jgi:predicted ATPase